MKRMEREREKIWCCDETVRYRSRNPSELCLVADEDLVTYGCDCRRIKAPVPKKLSDLVSNHD